MTARTDRKGGEKMEDALTDIKLTEEELAELLRDLPQIVRELETACRAEHN